MNIFFSGIHHWLLPRTVPHLPGLPYIEKKVKSLLYNYNIILCKNNVCFRFEMKMRAQEDRMRALGLLEPMSALALGKNGFANITKMVFHICQTAF